MTRVMMLAGLALVWGACGEPGAGGGPVGPPPQDDGKGGDAGDAQGGDVGLEDVGGEADAVGDVGGEADGAGDVGDEADGVGDAAVGPETDGGCLDDACGPPAPNCEDGLKNQGEADVDCGGPCGPCGFGASCGAAGDCVSGVCEGGQCAEADGCKDGVKGGDETDVDCGGPCIACATGKVCGGHQDCLSGTCIFGLCSLPTCDDDVQNQGETDVDCGGAKCGACGVGEGCQAAGDCESGRCEGGVCASCADGVKSGSETGVDCGGVCGATCTDGVACGGGGDCVSGRCDGGVCASCVDGVKSGGETDVDCGGVCGDSCKDGEACGSGGDCVSGRCDGGVCASCVDGVKSGGETDVDCGGVCAGCGAGQACKVKADCGAPNTCEGGVCCAANACGTCGAAPAEVCNGQDDDCDGKTDEWADLSIGQPKCEVQVGVCKGSTKNCGGSQGWLTCDAGQYAGHSAHYQAVEVSCDGLDNDCDGQTDEDPACALCGTSTVLLETTEDTAWSRQFFAVVGDAPVAVFNGDGTLNGYQLVTASGVTKLLSTNSDMPPVVATTGARAYVAMKAWNGSYNKVELYEVEGDGAAVVTNVHSDGSYWDQGLTVTARGDVVAFGYVGSDGRTMARFIDSFGDWKTIELKEGSAYGGELALAYDTFPDLHRAFKIVYGFEYESWADNSVTTYGGQSAANVSMVVAERPFLAYEVGSNVEVVALKSDGKQHIKHTITGASLPQLALDPSGQAIVAWWKGGKVEFSRLKDAQRIGIGSYSPGATPEGFNFVPGAGGIIHVGLRTSGANGTTLKHVVVCPTP